MSKTLDEILSQMKVEEYGTVSKADTKQAILQWVKDEVVGGEEPYYGTDYEAALTRGENEHKAEQCAILKQHGWKEQS